MKKGLIFALLMGVALLVGCSPKTTTYFDLEYVMPIEAREDKLQQFKSEEGYLFNFYVKEGDILHLQKGKKYDVTVSVEDWRFYGDFIEEIEKSK